MSHFISLSMNPKRRNDDDDDDAALMARPARKGKMVVFNPPKRGKRPTTTVSQLNAKSLPIAQESSSSHLTTLTDAHETPPLPPQGHGTVATTLGMGIAARMREPDSDYDYDTQPPSSDWGMPDDDEPYEMPFSSRPDLPVPQEKPEETHHLHTAKKVAAKRPRVSD